jgi:preprotein translocase subunit YajC
MTPFLFFSAAILAQAAPTPAPQGPNAIFGTIVPFLFMGVIFYFALIRPQQKKQREMRAMLSALKPNDRIVTNGGIHGVVTGLKDRTVSVRVADGVKIEFDKSAIVSVSRKDAVIDETPA